MLGTRCALAAWVTLLLLAPTAAQAATRSVTMGPPPSAVKSFEDLRSDVNAFFPTTTTISQGDTVKFVPVGFHTAELQARGGRPTPLISPTGEKVGGVNDAAGAPFWFNGQDQVGFTPSLAQSNFGKSVTYTGAASVNSGLPLAERPKPMKVRFPRRGTFSYLCNVHPGMKGKIQVRRAGAAVPSARSHARRAARQVALARARARKLRDQPAPAATFNVGVAGPGGVERLAFGPERLTVARGTTVTFRMSPLSYEVHTATSGPGDPAREPSSYLGTISASFQSPMFDPRGIYPSEPPGTIASISPSLHGNGFWNTGVLDRSNATPLPASGRARFDTAGSYTFYCVIHPDMKGTVDVG